MRPQALLIPLLTLVPLAAPAPSAAAIFKCVDADGAVTYTGQPCPERDVTESVLHASGTRPAPARRPRDASRLPRPAGRSGEALAGTRPPGLPAAAEPLEPPPGREPPADDRL